MNVRIDNFAKTIKEKNAKDARMANTLFVICLMAAAVVMHLFNYGDKGDFDVFQWENLACLIPLISVYLFTDKFYKKYQRIDDDVLPLNLSDTVKESSGQPINGALLQAVLWQPLKNYCFEKLRS